MAASVVKSNQNANNSGTSITVALTGVTSGNLLVVLFGPGYTGSGSAVAVGDITKSAGTATIGTVVIDDQLEGDAGGGWYHRTVIASIPITGDGDITIQVGNRPSGSWRHMILSELSGVDVSSSRVADTSNGSATSGTAASSGDATSGGAGIFIGHLTVNYSSSYSITEDGAFTLIYEWENGASYECGSGIYRIVSTDTTDAASWTLGLSAPWVAGVVVYKETPSVRRWILRNK